MEGTGVQLRMSLYFMYGQWINIQLNTLVQ